jgi:hypothetical protein
MLITIIPFQGPQNFLKHPLKIDHVLIGFWNSHITQRNSCKHIFNHILAKLYSNVYLMLYLSLHIHTLIAINTLWRLEKSLESS